MRAFCFIFFVTASVALAQTDGGTTGVLTKAPSLIKYVDAEFPADMLDAGTVGTVTMQLDVLADGGVTNVQVVESAGPSFDRAAVAAVQQFQFSPAELDGQPAAVRLTYAYTFSLRAETVEVPVAPPDAGAGIVNFSGVVLERGTRDPLALAIVVAGEGATALETTTNERGEFALADVPIGTQRVVVIAQDHAKYEVTETIEASKRTEVTYYVRRVVYGAMEAIIRGKKERKEVAQVTLKQEEIRLIPGTNGDAFKVVQNLPGVARTPFGLGFLVVRGGKPWDTKVYVDEALVPVLFHFGGLFSTYNSSLLESLSFQAGNFNADFGRGIGALVKAEGRTPSKKGIHGYADINLVDASGMIEFPLGENWSATASARRSYIDAVLPAVLGLVPGANDAIRFTVAPRYYDYQLRLEYKPTGRSNTRFFVSFFGSNDRLVAALPNPAIDPEGRGSFGTSIAYNRLLFGFDTQISKTISFRTRTSFGIDDFGFSGGTDLYANAKTFPILTRNTFTFDLPKLNLQISAGLDVYALPYQIDVQSVAPFKLNQIPDPFASRQLTAEHTFVFQVEPGLFTELMWKPFKSVKVIGGLRGDYNTQMKKGWLDPRLAAFWQVHERVTIKGAMGLYHQSPDYRQGQLSPKFGNPNLHPEAAAQYMIGTEVQFTDAISLDVQLYYKELFHQVRSTLAADASDINLEAIDLRYTNVGKGRGYGAEILLRHALTKNFFGWIAYSLSRTERDYLSGTQYGLSPFDQTHNLIVVASYKLPFDFIVGAKLRFTTGALSTPVVGSIYDANGNYYFPIYGKQFSRRLPGFFQLDLRIDKRFVFERWMLALYLDIQNVTYRKNVEAVLNSFDYSQEAYLTGLPILPVLGMRAEW